MSHDLIEASYFRELSAHLSAVGFVVFDAASVPAGTSIRSTVRQLMSESDGHVILLNRRTCGSPDVNLEIAAARLAATERPGFRIVPVILDRAAEIPPLLSDYASLDGRRPQREVAVALAEVLRRPAPHRNPVNERAQIAICAQSLETTSARRRYKLDEDARILSQVPAMALLVGVVGLLVGWLSSLLSDGPTKWLAVALVVGAVSVVAPVAVLMVGVGRSGRVNGHSRR